MLIIVPILLLCLNSAVDAKYINGFPTVHTNWGKIRGTYRQESSLHPKYAEFVGIPYARQPVGDLRFMPPQPMQLWNGILHATSLAPPCVQLHPTSINRTKMLIGDEDCLYLNIYVPVTANTEPKPVLVWIHGGSFQHGTGTSARGKYLMEYKIVFVTINYRLGPLGFLSTEDEIVPGNMGLKDQNMALRWISENIIAFEGDPNRITLIGLDAGGASVHYHYLSKLSTGFFQGGISMSGTAFNTWALTKKPLEKTKLLAKLLLCPTNDNKDMIKCLKKVPASIIVEATESLIPYATNSYVTFGPVVEISGDLAFIDKPPYEIIKKREVQDLPWITGVAEADGLYFSSELASPDYLVNTMDFYWDAIIPYLFGFQDSIESVRIRSTMASRIRYHYYGNGPINKEKNFVEKFVEMTTDRLFKADSMVAAMMQARANNQSVWYYNYNYRGDLTTCDTIYNIKENYGACHGDDAYNVIDDSRYKPKTFYSITMKQTIIYFVLNFVKDKIPHINWVRWNRLNPHKEKFEYLEFKHPYNMQMNESINFGNINLWENNNLSTKYF